MFSLCNELISCTNAAANSVLMTPKQGAHASSSDLGVGYPNWSECIPIQRWHDDKIVVRVFVRRVRQSNVVLDCSAILHSRDIVLSRFIPIEKSNTGRAPRLSRRSPLAASWPGARSSATRRLRTLPIDVSYARDAISIARCDESSTSSRTSTPTSSRGRGARGPRRSPTRPLARFKSAPET